MNSSMEQLHDVLHTNLSLLKESGHDIDFEKGMFHGYNIHGFEKVSYALLMIIDPDECKKSLPWPLLDDRRRRIDYRNKFIKFIKMINKRYSEAHIPEINASSLQQPGGVKFVEFMCCLSTFTLELELRKMLSPDETEELLPRPEPSAKSKDMEAKMKIVQSARLEAEVRLNEITDYYTESVDVLERLNVCRVDLETKLQSAESKLKESVLSLTLDDHIKTRLLDIQDTNAMDDWESKTEKQLLELERNCEKIITTRDLSATVCEKIEDMNKLRSRSRPCLDGAKLKLTSTIAQFAGSPVYNSRGEVRLAAVLKAGAAAVRSLEPVEPVDQSLIGEARVQLALAHGQLDRAEKLTASRDELKNDCRKTINELQPLVYKHIEQKPERSELYKCLQPRPPLQLLTSADILKNQSPHRQIRRGKKTWKLLPSLKKKVVCSVKKRRHSGSTMKNLNKRPKSLPRRTGLKTPVHLAATSSDCNLNTSTSHLLPRPSVAPTSVRLSTAYRARRSILKNLMGTHKSSMVEQEPSVTSRQPASAQLPPVCSGSSFAEPFPEVVEDQESTSDQKPEVSLAPKRKSLELLVKRYLALRRNMK